MAKKPKAKTPKPQPIPTDYSTFLYLAQHDEAFRRALYDVQGKNSGDAQYITIHDKLVGRGVTSAKATYYLDKMVTIDWHPIYEMEQQLGRAPDDLGVLMG
jgi:hypothetical protein